MKKLLIPLLLIPVIALAEGAKVTDNACETGVIQNLKYNSNDTMSITVNGVELYTTRWNLEKILVEAYYIGGPISIYTSSCYTGGGFAEVVFNSTF